MQTRKNKIKTKRQTERERDSFFEYFSLAPATGPTSSDLKDLGIVVIFLRPPANSFRRLVSVTRSDPFASQSAISNLFHTAGGERSSLATTTFSRLPHFLRGSFCLVPRTHTGRHFARSAFREISSLRQPSI